ncbi:MAG: DNA-processing protein DprA, partial [Alphaproteobacteria bacterium]
EQTGLVIAEMPPGTKPTPWHFPIRNRVIASLALGVVVVEAAARSGSLITAREAAERGGEVMAVPGSPLDPRAEGCNTLIREGATLVQNTSEIVECLSRPVSAGLPERDDRPNPIHRPGPESVIAECRTVILQGLGTEPTEIDDLVRWCKTDTATVLAALLELELAGAVYRHHGNRVSRRADL